MIEFIIVAVGHKNCTESRVVGGSQQVLSFQAACRKLQGGGYKTRHPNHGTRATMAILFYRTFLHSTVFV